MKAKIIIPLILIFVLTLSLGTAYFEYETSKSITGFGLNYNTLTSIGEGVGDTLIVTKTFGTSGSKEVIDVSTGWSYVSQSSSNQWYRHYDYNGVNLYSTFTGTSLAEKYFYEYNSTWGDLNQYSFKTALGNPYNIQDYTEYNGDFYVIPAETGSTDIHRMNKTHPSTIEETYSLSYTAKGIEYYNNTFYVLEALGGGFKIYLYDTDFDYIGYAFETTVSGASGSMRGLAIINNKAYIGDDGTDLIYILNNVSGTTDLVDSDFFEWNGDYYRSNLCMDEDYYCSNATILNLVLGDYPYCANNDTTYCANGCVNEADANGIYSGTCSNYGCENECLFQFQNSCTTGNTYQTCGFYDADACLDLSSVYYCPANQYCYEDELGAYCDVFNETVGGDSYKQDLINVDISLSSNTGSLENEGSTETQQKSGWYNKIGVWLHNLVASDTYDIKTSLDEIETDFAVGVFNSVTSASQDYLATSCQYEETVSFQENIVLSTNFEGTYTHNTSGDYAYIHGTTPINYTFVESQNQYIETIIEIDGTGTYNVDLYDGSSIITELEIKYNTTDFTLVIEEKQNGKVLVSSTSTSDDLAEIYIGLKYISNIDNVNTEISIVRNVLGTYVNEYFYSLPLSVSTGKNPNKMVYDGNGNDLKIYQVSGVTVNDYPIFYKNQEASKITQCEYTETGCFFARVYGNDQAIPTYHFYDTDRVCVTEINGQIIVLPDEIQIENERSLIEKILNTDWNEKQKLMFAVLIVFVVMGFFSVLSITTKTPFPLMIGTIISGMLLLYFVVDGFIPVWVILIFGVIGALIGAGIVRNAVIGKGGN